MDNPETNRSTEERVISLKSEMENIRQEFIKQSGVILRQWYKELSDKEIENEEAVTASLGTDQFNHLKQDINDLIEHADQVAMEFIGDETKWWHLNESDIYFVDFDATSPSLIIPLFIEMQLRLAVGKLGPILEKYGYRIKTQPNIASDKEYGLWCEPYKPYQNPIRPMYPYSLMLPRLSNEMRKLLDQYHKYELLVQEARSKY
ncbi:MAG: hypothetical protein ABI690_34055 [Chloroflexota bacterium]